MSKKWLVLLAALLTGQAVFTDLAAADRKTLYMRQKKQETVCLQNLQNLYNYLNLYAKNNQGAYPAGNNFAGLKKLFALGIAPTNFYCEDYRGKKTKKLADLNETTNPYLYFGNFDRKLIESCPKVVLICSKPASRHHLALLGDGSIVDIREKLPKIKIKSAYDIVEALNTLYKYPSGVLNTLRNKARLMDKQSAGK